jgi:HK97 family phage prohead protease
MKTKSDILQRLQGIVEELQNEETALPEFATGDLVTFTDGKSKLVGLIESYDQETLTVRVQAQAGDKMEPTDDVRTLSYDQVSKYTVGGEPEEEGEEEEVEEEEVEEDEQKSFDNGTWVSFESKDGSTKGIIVGNTSEGYVIEVYAEVNGEVEDTGVEVTHRKSALTVINPPAIKQAKREILAKMNDVEMSMDENELGYIKGYASTYGNVDLGGDVVAKGAFTQTLNHKGNRIKLFFDHKYDIKDMAGIGTMRDDEKGLLLEGKMPIKAQDVRNSFEKIKFMLEEGMDIGLSIGYDVVKSIMRPDGIRELKEIALHEVSITPFPMNTEALILSAKSRKIAYQAKKQAWQTIVHPNKPDAPDGNQLTQDDIASLVEELKSIIHR